MTTPIGTHKFDPIGRCISHDPCPCNIGMDEPLGAFSKYNLLKFLGSKIEDKPDDTTDPRYEERVLRWEGRRELLAEMTQWVAER